jgi:hypothetical protein
MEYFWLASKSNRVTTPSNETSFLYVDTATYFGPLRPWSGPSKRYFKVSQPPASWKPDFTILCNSGFYTVHFVVCSWETNKCINLNQGFPLLFAPGCFGIIYAIFRKLTCVYWVTCIFWVVVDKILHDGWRCVLKSDEMCSSLVRNAAYCVHIRQHFSPGYYTSRHRL